MNPSDPPRLLGHPDTPDALREALRQGRGELPSAERLARIAALLDLPSTPEPPAGPPPDAAPPPGAPPVAVPPAASLLSTVIGPLLVGSTVTLGVLGVTGNLPSRSAAPLATTASTARAPVRSEPLRAPIDEPRPVVEAIPPPSVSAPSLPSSIPASPDPSQAPRSSVAAPGASLATGTPRASTTPEVTPPASASAELPAPGVSASAPDPMVPPAETESSLLHRARVSLASSPARAIELTTEHAKLYPGGVLVQERELVAIEALVKLGRTGEARSQAAAFLARFPGSAHRRRILTLLPDLAASEP